jgi:hypothetical protein
MANSGMASTTLTHPLWAWRYLRVLRGIPAICAIATLTIVVFSLAGTSWNFFFFLLACAIFATLLCVARPLSGRALAGERESVLLGTLVIWVFLLVSEAIFIHNQTTQSAAKGNVGNNALYQATSWILSFSALALISYFSSFA